MTSDTGKGRGELLDELAELRKRVKQLKANGIDIARVNDLANARIAEAKRTALCTHCGLTVLTTKTAVPPERRK